MPRITPKITICVTLPELKAVMMLSGKISTSTLVSVETWAISPLISPFNWNPRPGWIKSITTIAMVKSNHAGDDVVHENSCLSAGQQNRPP